MPRPPDGTTAAATSRTAVAVAVAARAALLSDGSRKEFVEEHGFRIGDRSISDALKKRRRPRATAEGEDPDQREWLWDSFEVDAAKLGLDEIVAWIPRPAHAEPREDQSRLLEAFRRAPGVVSILDCFDGTIVLRALTAGPLEKRRLQTNLLELAPGALWAEVRQADREQAARGWLQIARSIAASEERLEPEKQIP